jgi:hypothetical protein
MHHADVKRHQVPTACAIARCRENAFAILHALANPKFASHRQKISSKCFTVLTQEIFGCFPRLQNLLPQCTIELEKIKNSRFLYDHE